MNVLRFVGKNSREALNKVREALGDDAIIVSNRLVNGGNEVMAYRDDALETATSEREIPSPSLTLLPIQDDGPISLLSHINNKNRERDAAVALTRNHETLFLQQEEQAKASVSVAEMQATMSANSDLTKTEQMNLNLTSTNLTSSNREMAAMLDEMREMRNILEAQISTLSWSNNLQRDPIKSSALCTLLGAGFSTSLSRKLTENTPATLTKETISVWVKAILSQHLNIIENESEVLDKGGVFALVGPTGVGKTTTTAKLAARYVMKHGTENLG